MKKKQKSKQKKPVELSKEVEDMLNSVDTSERTSPERPRFYLRLVKCADNDLPSKVYGEFGTFYSLDELENWVKNEAATCFKDMADSGEEIYQNLLGGYEKEHPKKSKAAKKTA